MREQVIEQINQHKIIAIIRGAEPEQCRKMARAIYDGGFKLMEITYDMKAPASWQTTADLIGELAKEYEGRMLVGAGTVTCVELVEMTAKAGGTFIISPDTDVDVIKKTRELGLVSMPGALTPTEIKTAHNAGADFVKLFPADSMGPKYIKAVRAPLGHIKLVATGGVNEKNLADFLAAGASGAGIGGNLANKAWADAGEYDKITEVARQMTRVVEEFSK